MEGAVHPVFNGPHCSRIGIREFRRTGISHRGNGIFSFIYKFTGKGKRISDKDTV
jgi:hypothetical protein